MNTDGYFVMEKVETVSKVAGEVITTRTAKVWIGEDGISRVIRHPGAEEGLADAKEIIEAGGKLAKGEKILNLSDIRGLKSASREARQYFRMETSKYLIASAALVDSQISRMVGNFYIAVNKPDYPIKIFTSETKAIEWLKGFL